MRVTGGRVVELRLTGPLRRDLGASNCESLALSLDSFQAARILRRMTEAALNSLSSAEIEAISRKLLAHGIQPTPQRLDIAAIFFAGDLHLSADQVIARLERGNRPVSKATVYNTLGLFAERGLLTPVSVDSSKIFYDSNTRPHYHFYNVDDGVLMDVAPGALAVDKLPAPPDGTVAEAVDIVIRVRNHARREG